MMNGVSYYFIITLLSKKGFEETMIDKVGLVLGPTKNTAFHKLSSVKHF